jgi:CRP-like cAMP-binding protein
MSQRSVEQRDRVHQLKALKRQYLSQVEIFQDLSMGEIEQIQQGFHMTPHVPKGRLVYQAGETPEALFILKKGSVHIYRLSPQGKRLVIDDVLPGTFFGDMAFIGQSMQGSFAETAEESCICVLSRLDLERLIQRHPQVALRIMRVMSRRLAQSENQLENLALKSLTSRLATLILQRTVHGAKRMTELSHQDLAERVGTTRETATQVLDGLKAAGLIAIGRRRIDVLDSERLIEVAEAYSWAEPPERRFAAGSARSTVRRHVQQSGARCAGTAR